MLREVGLVKVRDDGRQRLYRVNGQALEPIFDWVKRYEQQWSKRFDQMDVVLAELREAEQHPAAPIKGTEDGDGDSDE